jgi:hypothetical protein
MDVWMAYYGPPIEYYDYVWYLNNTTSYGHCWSGNVPPNYGLIRQFDGAASHTIYGRNDDSPNHTNCTPAFGV